MFGRKARKQAEQEALKRMMEEAEANRRAAEAAAYATEQQAKVYYDSEIIFDDNDDGITNDYYEYTDGQEVMTDVAEPVQSDVAALPVPDSDQPAEVKDEQATEQPVNEDEQPEKEADEQTVNETAQEQTDSAVQQDAEEQPEQEEENQMSDEAEDTPEEEQGDDAEVRYVVDGPAEDDELVKPAKLVRLPNLVDYMLSLKTSKRMKINIATLLIGAYAKFKDVPAEKEIIIGCMKKVMFALMNA